MKLVKLLNYVGLFGLLLVFACNDDDDTPPVVEPGGNPTSMDSTITEVAAGIGDFSTLVAQLQATDLDDVLNGTGPFTVFAPTNAAFAKFLEDNNLNIEDVPAATLRNILLNHVVSGSVKAADLTTGYKGFLAEEAEDNAKILNFINAGSTTINGGVNITGTDKLTKNGVIHTVDRVIALPTVVSHATSNSNFSTLVAALTREGLDTDFVATLSGDGPFTVFAPTNDAFAALLTELGASSLDDIDNETLSAVLKYHVIAGSNVRSTELTDGQVAATLSTDSITINTEGGVKITDGRNRVATVVAADVQAINGVVHAIDKVILPPTGEAPVVDSTIVGVADRGGFSALIAAATRAGLVETLQGEGPLTVFAPTDAAFTAFLSQNNFSSVADIPVAVLASVLKNHVISGKVMAADLTTGYVGFLATESSGDMAVIKNYIDAANTKINTNVNITMTDIAASNGVIHVVDSVIALPTVVTHALSNPNFSVLVQALTRSDLTTDFVATLSGDGPFTVFAPTNDAFTALLEELELETLADVPVATLEAVLKYHVIAGANIRASEISNGQTVTTLLDQNFMIATGGETPVITDASNRTSDIIATDVQAANGVVHAIDRVLVPSN